MKNKDLITAVSNGENLSIESWQQLIENWKSVDLEWLHSIAREVQYKYFGNKIYIRGLIELTNYCKNNCLYCGIRAGNSKVERYRLSLEDVVASCEKAYTAGFRTFVIQGGEDPFFSSDKICNMLREIKKRFPNVAITLSLGERDREDYKLFKEAGADRYLLRHETALKEHYDFLHEKSQSFEKRMDCISELKKNAYQTGVGFMVGSPKQTSLSLAYDMDFIYNLKPEMVGIGPFLPHRETPFKDEEKGDLQKTLFFISIIRLMLPMAMLPATTALATLSPDGRSRGILAGANVIMPNISPPDIRDCYQLYDNKANKGLEAVEGLLELQEDMKKIGYEIIMVRGDFGDVDVKERLRNV